jgi:hypothetical protein
MAKYTDEQIVMAYQAAGFCYTGAAKTLGWTWGNLWLHRQQRPDLQKKLDAAKNQVIEDAEKKLLTLMESKDEKIKLQAVKFMLERKGGYREQKSLTVDLPKDDSALVEAAIRAKHGILPDYSVDDL